MTIQSSFLFIIAVHTRRGSDDDDDDDDEEEAEEEDLSSNPTGEVVCI